LNCAASHFGAIIGAVMRQCSLAGRHSVATHLSPRILLGHDHSRSLALAQ
jgi:hypothetical protein